MVSSLLRPRLSDVSAPGYKPVPSILLRLRKRTIGRFPGQLRKTIGRLIIATRGHRDRPSPSPWVENQPFRLSEKAPQRRGSMFDLQLPTARPCRVSTPQHEETDHRLRALIVTVLVDMGERVSQCQGQLHGMWVLRTIILVLLRCIRTRGGGRSGTCVSSR